MKKRRKILTLLLCAALLIGLVPYTAQEAQAADIQIQTGEPTFTVNQSVVAFGGHDWWVIGMPDESAGKGVNPVANTVTLLAKDNDFGDSVFREGEDSEFPGSKRYSGDGRWYAGMDWGTPNEYKGSTLQQKMESITSEETDPHFINSRESALIKARTLNEGMTGGSVSDQKLWALSKSECDTISKTTNGNAVLKYDNWWWLRSPGIHDNDAAFVYGYGSVASNGDGVVTKSFAVRPALNLNLESVLFTSAASGTSGKSSAAVGGNLVGASAPTNGAVKFTVKDTGNQKLKVSAVTKSGDTLVAKYSEATVAQEKQYLSCVLMTDSGEVRYYGKLKQVDSADKASGTVEIPLAKVNNGNYKLQIFSEETNGDKFTDFCSEPVEMSISVADGNGTVTDFTGETHEHSYGDEWESNDTYHWKKCQTANCFVDNSQKDSYAEHSYVGGECTVCHATDSIFKPSITVGADSTWYKGSKTGLSITSDAAIAHFQKVQVDGQDITQANYEVKEGSTIVTLKADYLESLPAGKHTVSIVSKIGAAETSFTIAEKTGGSTNTNGGTTDGGQNQGNTNNPQTGGKNQGNTDSPQTGGKNQGNITAPQTGDNSHMALWIALMLLSLAGIGGTVWHSRKTS